MRSPSTTSVSLKFTIMPAPKSITSVGLINRKTQIHSTVRMISPITLLYLAVTIQRSFAGAMLQCAVAPHENKKVRLVHALKLFVFVCIVVVMRQEINLFYRCNMHVQSVL